MKTGGEARFWLATLLACMAGGVAAQAPPGLPLDFGIHVAPAARDNRNADLCAVPAGGAKVAKPKRSAKQKVHAKRNKQAKRKQQAKPAQLAMPTTIVAQSGARIVQTTKIVVAGCPRHKKSTRHRRRPLQSGGHGHHRHRHPVRRDRALGRRGR